LPASAAEIKWQHLTSKNGDLPVPGESTQQTGAIVADFDRDGVNDFVLSFRRRRPRWFGIAARRRLGPLRHRKRFSHGRSGRAVFDIDADGDLDLVFGGDYQSNEFGVGKSVAPFRPERFVETACHQKGSATQHHDQVFGDFLGRGKPQLAFWNQGAKKLFLAEIPADPRHAESWPLTEIFSGAAGERGDQGAFKYAEGWPRTMSMAMAEWICWPATIGSNTRAERDSRRSKSATSRTHRGGTPEGGRYPQW